MCHVILYLRWIIQCGEDLETGFHEVYNSSVHEYRAYIYLFTGCLEREISERSGDPFRDWETGVTITSPGEYYYMNTVHLHLLEGAAFFFFLHPHEHMVINHTPHEPPPPPHGLAKSQIWRPPLWDFLDEPLYMYYLLPMPRDCKELYTVKNTFSFKYFYLLGGTYKQNIYLLEHENFALKQIF